MSWDRGHGPHFWIVNGVNDPWVGIGLAWAAGYDREGLWYSKNRKKLDLLGGIRLNI